MFRNLPNNRTIINGAGWTTAISTASTREEALAWARRMWEVASAAERKQWRAVVWHGVCLWVASKRESFWGKCDGQTKYGF